METVIEISSGEEDDLLIIKPKKVKLEKEENVNFTVKTIPGDGHCIVNCFSMFFGKDSSEILSLPWDEFQETFIYSWVSVNIRARKNFSKAWKNVSLTSAIITILSI